MALLVGEEEFVMKPIVNGWREKIRKAIQGKRTFSEVAEECSQFFSGRNGFMWDDEFRRKFIKGNLSPKFAITLNKAFELVALFGPTLYWRNPQRAVKVRKPIELDPAVFGDMQDPMAMQLFQQGQAEQQQKAAVDKVRASLMEAYLNYTPTEQWGDGLAGHAEKAITEALIKGRGCLWTEPYSFPGSQRMLTGSFYDSVDNLFIDPDAESFDEAKWIAKRCIQPVWEVEREYKLPAGSLKKAASMESAESQAERVSKDDQNMERSRGQTFDTMVYYKIWSKGGIGTRMTGVQSSIKDSLEKALGDYCYLVIAPGVDYPLNAPNDAMIKAQEQELKKMFEWPVPYWTDNRWPVCCLDFYNKPRSVWPVSPLSPGMGQLIFMNCVISQLANKVWSTSRTMAAVLQGAAEELKRALQSGRDMEVFEVPLVGQKIGEIIQFIEHPPLGQDLLMVLDRITHDFEQATGLNELLYGIASTQSRSAQDAQIKEEKASVRPDYMAGKVEKWMSEVARCEKFCCRWYIEPEDVEPLVGKVGAYLWHSLINSHDPDVVVREMDATVEAGSAKKPNKARDVANLSSVMQSLMSVLDKHADVTGDTRPENELIKQYGEAIDQDLTPMLMGPRTPAANPQAEQEAQAAQQQHSQEMEMSQQQHQMDMAGKQFDLQAKQQELAMKSQQMQMEQNHQASQMEMDRQQSEQDMAMKAMAAKLDLSLQAHRASAERQASQQKISSQRQMDKQKLNTMKAAAKAKPKPQGAGSGR